MANNKAKKVFGILGGMGPQASCELYRILNARYSQSENYAQNKDFPHLLINSLPVPDLVGSQDGKAQTISMVYDGAMVLERAGATDIFMACNTMHAFQNDICSGLTKARFHSMIDIVADQCCVAKNVLILGTRTTLQMGLYQNAFIKRQIQYTIPDESLLSKTVSMILDTISGVVDEQDLERYLIAVKGFLRMNQNIDTIILGCTELPLIFPKEFEGCHVISSLDAMVDYIQFIHQDESGRTPLRRAVNQ